MSEHAEKSELLNRTTVGFWFYIMTDCMVFASLFATYVVLRDATAHGPSGMEIFEMPTALAETIILLTSSFTSGLALIAVKEKKLRQMYVALAATFALGLAFLAIEISEFAKFVAEGHSWQQSAFLSAFFALVGTHGFHILIGLIWLFVLVWGITRKGLTDKLTRQMSLFGMFWHFLDLVWIFIFTVVYLMGVAI